jgi:hypothetical protein
MGGEVERWVGELRSWLIGIDVFVERERERDEAT